MSWLFKILDSAGVNQAGVDSNNNVKVNGPTTKAQAGFFACAGRNDDGTITGTALVNRAYVTEHQGLRLSVPVPIWDDSFNATAQNTSKYRAPVTSGATTFAGGTMNLVNTTTNAHNCALQTYKNFPLFDESEKIVTVSGYWVVTPQTNNVLEIGLFSAVLPGVAVPTDGTFFRLNAAGEFRGVISFNGSETQTAAIASPSIGVNHDFRIVITTNVVRFYVDGILQASITLSTDAPTLGQPHSASTQPVTLRNYNTGAVSSLQTLKVSNISVVSIGMDQARDFATLKCGLGHMAYQGQNGNTMGTTAQLVNNTLAGAAVPTNTTAALGSGLGGHFLETISLAQGTDGILQSYQNPVGSSIITPRNLIITGLSISCITHTVHAATIWNCVLYLAYGHTAVSLATGEAATTKAPRRIALPAGFTQPVSAAAGSIPVGSPVNISFKSPIVVAPGEFVAIVTRKITAAPATGAVYWSIMYDAYFE